MTVTVSAVQQELDRLKTALEADQIAHEQVRKRLQKAEADLIAAEASSAVDFVIIAKLREQIEALEKSLPAA